jgi:tRNA U34 5-methylaminomethyl-2-thiouridine-forming methyltransferase MnmC
MKETYHSKFGAVQEAYHVFIKNGLALTKGQPVSILEIGFGTGLNAFITYLEAKKAGQQVYYEGIEAYPIPMDEVPLLNYAGQTGAEDEKEVFNLMHYTDWDRETAISDKFILKKRKLLFQDIKEHNKYDLIYFDAFGYHAQPELWDTVIFKAMHTALKTNGILVTYACRTVIKKAMQEAGLTVEKLPGPPGKREMLRAVKL